MALPTFGLVLMDKRLKATALCPNGAGTFDSTYTQAGPVPSLTLDPTGRWAPFIVGDQDVDLDLLVVRGGYPGRWAASVAARLDTETSDEDWRGWDEPSVLVNVSAHAGMFASGLGWDRFMAGCGLPDQRILITTLDDSASEATTFRYDPRTEAWESLFVWDVSAAGLGNPFAMEYDAELERVILWSGPGAGTAPASGDNSGWIAYASTDSGATWALYARGFFEVNSGGANGVGLDAAPKDGQDWLLVMNGDIGDFGPTAEHLGQFASSDNGVTWDLVEFQANQFEAHCAATRTGFVIAYINSDDEPAVKVIPTARTPVSQVTEIVVDDTATRKVERVLIEVDDDGIVYLMTRGLTTGALRDEVRIYYSLDDGVTWARYSWDVLGGSDDAFQEWDLLLAANGQLHAVGVRETTGGGSGDADKTVMLHTFGGWSNVENGAGLTGFVRTRSDRFGYGKVLVPGEAPNSAEGRMWVPWDTPGAMGWTSSGTATQTQVPSGEPAAMQVTRTSSTRTYFYSAISSPTAPQHEFGCGQVCLKLNSTGNVSLATIGTGSACRIRHGVTDGTNDWEMQINVGTDGVNVVDRNNASAVLASKTDFDPTTEYFHLRWNVRRGKSTGDGQVDLWYRALGSEKWILIADALALVSAVSANAEFSWGNGASQNSDVFWRMAGVALSANWRSGLDDITEAGLDTNVVRRQGLQFGKAVPTEGQSYPVPMATAGLASGYGYVQGGGGPGVYLTTTSHPVAYTQGVAQLAPTDSPSPRQGWQSTGTAAAHFCWDLGENTYIGNVIGVVLMQCWPAEFEVEVSDDGVSWTSLGTMDKSYSALTYTRDGAIIRPRPGTATLPRYIREGELVGGYAKLGAAFAREIVGNTGGYWTEDTTVQQCVLRLGDIDGTEPGNGVGLAIVPPNAVALFQVSTPNPDAFQYVRVVFDASQVTPGGIYKAGVVGVGRVMAAGADPSWEYQRQMELTRELTRRTDEFLQVRRTGPPRRVWSYTWPDGVIQRDLHDATSPSPAVAFASGMAMGTQEDVGSSFIGAIEHELDSGEIPVVVVPKLPTAATGGGAATVLTDPSAFLYGRLLSDAQGVHGVVGEEGSSDLVRVDGLTFEELR